MRKSELGNLVAANMADIIGSKEYRTLFHKQAKAEEKKEEEEAEEGDDECDVCSDTEECNECEATDKVAKLKKLLNNVLKMSKDMDELGFTKGASYMLKFAHKLVQASAEDIEELINATLAGGGDLPDITSITLEDKPKSESRVGPEVGLEVEEPEESEEDIVAQLEAIERGEGSELEGLDIPGIESKPEELESLDIPGLEEIEAAVAEVDVWLKKNGTEKGSNIKLDDFNTILVTAGKEVEDYLIEKNMGL